MGEYGKSLKKCLDKLCIINFSKSYIIVDATMRMDDMFVYMGDGKFPKMINKQNIVTMEYLEDREVYKVLYISAFLAKGILSKIEGKFITLKIRHDRDKDYYYNIVPVKSIKGIKVFTDDMEDDKYDGSQE